MFFSTKSRQPFTRGALVFAAITLPAFAQFDVAGRSIELHGFASQGFAYSNNNNYLTMSTSTGTFAFTDAGLNVSTQITDRLRVGAQAYVREIGILGRGQLKLDWALADYRFSDTFGIRVGKIKTVLGLCNDTQDVESLHTWAIMPQSLYALDQRDSSLAHTGGDLYGRWPLSRVGNLAYTLYAGATSNDRNGGYVYSLRALLLNARKVGGAVEGADLKWTTPVPGVLLGASHLESQLHMDGTNLAFGIPFRTSVNPERRTVFSAQYDWRNLRLSTEYSRDSQSIRDTGVYAGYGVPITALSFTRVGWYVAGSYRLSRHLELGSYYSRFFPNANKPGLGVTTADGRHMFDNTFTARIDFTSHWDLKLEEHLINGYGDPTSGSGFYLAQNPNGLLPKTKLFVMRAGFSF